MASKVMALHPTIMMGRVKIQNFDITLNHAAKGMLWLTSHFFSWQPLKF